jgi:lipoprotein-releasing system permease protein
LFELRVALKYLIPKRRSVSTALISAMSVLVISLVVWLVLVFLSVTAGIERNWLVKLTSLHAPIRLSPTDGYYNSYFYQIDALSAASDYTYKTIGEKSESPRSDPYSAEADVEIPLYWQKAERIDGELLDPVKRAFSSLDSLQNESPLAFQDYEIGGALMRLSLRDTASTLSQMSYLLSIPDRNPRFRSLLLPVDEGPLDFEKAPPKPLPYAHFVAGRLQLPDFGADAPAILPKNYRESGVRLGDRGTLNYLSQAAASAQEQKIPIRVAGFYDPGVMAVGNKCLLVPSQITRAIHGASQTFSPDGTPTNGIFVWIDDLSSAREMKAKIEEKLRAAGVASYWKVATFEEFEFAKDLLQQFRSDRTLLLLIAAIILLVACSNIISLLVLLVNDKKKEIAILQSMGASFRSIASIFGFCGAAMGAVSSLFGTALAVFTLRHLDSLVSFLSALQGRAAFHPAFFGQSLPNQLSYEALLFVLIATPLLSLAAGLIPALKASRIRPSSVLRSE